LSELDTSAEAVKQLAAELCGRWDDVFEFLKTREQAAATLRALVAERDMWRDRLTKVEAQAVRNISDACAERDRFSEELKLIRRAWLNVIQVENKCRVTMGRCFATRCGCLAEMEAIIDDARK
jgi:hypothetical protein